MNEVDGSKFEHFLLNSGLYDKFEVNDEDVFNIIRTSRNEITPKFLNLYCVNCKNKSVFNYHNTEVVEVNKKVKDIVPKMSVYTAPIGSSSYNTVTKNKEENKRKDNLIEMSISIIYQCARFDCHTIIFNLGFIGNQIIKIGQYPSVGDLNYDEVSQYSKVLDRKDAQELNKAIGLSSHRVGVASFVYLRRVVERLIYRTFNENKDEIYKYSGVTEDKFKKMKVREKIKAIRKHLPVDFSTAGKSVYKILSKGVHDLEEDECIKMFPVIKELIFITLNDELRRKDEEVRRKRLKDKIGEYEGSLQ